MALALSSPKIGGTSYAIVTTTESQLMVHPIGDAPGYLESRKTKMSVPHGA